MGGLVSSQPEYENVDADVAHQLGTFVTKSFKESQDRSSCLSCSTRPKSYIKSLTVYERDPSDRRYRMTVDLDHDRDSSYSHVWYNKVLTKRTLLKPPHVNFTETRFLLTSTWEICFAVLAPAQVMASFSSASEANPLLCSSYGSKLLKAMKAQKLAVDGTNRQLKHTRREVRASSSLAFVKPHDERRYGGVVPTSMGEGGRFETWRRSGSAAPPLTAEARGHPLLDATRHSLAVSLSGGVLELVDVALWEASDEDSVPLEFLFTGVPSDVDEEKLALALTEKLQERLQEERRAEFRSQLKKRQESSLRRRKAGPEEGGDGAEEQWRSYLRKPAPEVKLKVQSVFDAGTRVRKVLGCRVLVSPEAADDLGKICFRHIFESEEEEKERLRQLQWYEDPFLVCFYSCSCVLVVVMLLWLAMLLPAILRQS
ncbi:unnamed protein product [Symbiodinium sp. CCMP2456]|nr:unnamed protein product [Symbiodinium sp. CCMP2456]